LLRPLEVAAALFLVVVVFKVHRQNRALHRQLIKLKARVDALQAEDYRTLMRSLNKQRTDLHMHGAPLAPTESPAASKPASPKMAAPKMPKPSSARLSRWMRTWRR
jgi:hypothetical protein